MRLLILADDLSGAADCAAGCLRAGLSTVVRLDAADTPHRFEAVALDADTRRLPPGEAASAQRALLERCMTPRPSIIYKKIDSTLRGAFVEEMWATRSLAGPPIIAPAFPATGRTVIDGKIYVNDLPLEATEVWKNEKRTDRPRLLEMLERGGFSPQLIPLATVRRGDELHKVLADALKGPDTALVCDAETENDLAHIALATRALAPHCQLVGSGGLMRHLPTAHGLTHPGQTAANTLAARQGPLVTVVGSIASVARRQCWLVAQMAQTETHFLDPQFLLQGARHLRWNELQQKMLNVLNRGHHLVVAISGEFPNLAEGWKLAGSLAKLLTPMAPLAGGLIVTGGETARAVLSAWKIDALEVVGELEAGIPLSCALGERRIPVVTKAGAFGDDQCLVRAVHLLKKAL